MPFPPFIALSLCHLPTSIRQPARAAGEHFDTLLAAGVTRIERIVSWGQASPPGFWYDQVEGEWVALLVGRARLNLREPDEAAELAAGDWFWIAPHRRHRLGLAGEPLAAPGSATRRAFRPARPTARRRTAGGRWS